jgi:hypothetical protein
MISRAAMVDRSRGNASKLIVATCHSRRMRVNRLACASPRRGGIRR